jgi:hypothetical protein
VSALRDYAWIGADSAANLSAHLRDQRNLRVDETGERFMGDRRRRD